VSVNSKEKRGWPIKDAGIAIYNNTCTVKLTQAHEDTGHSDTRNGGPEGCEYEKQRASRKEMAKGYDVTVQDEKKKRKTRGEEREMREGMFKC
jgi:hypothetical protein